MHIIDVCAFYTPQGGGVRTYVERELEALPALGHRVTVVVPGPVNRVEERALVRESCRCARPPSRSTCAIATSTMRRGCTACKRSATGRG